MWALVLALAVGSGSTEQQAQRHAAMEAQAAQRQASLLRTLVQRGDTAAVEYVVRTVRAGLPPVALHAFLDGARAHPHASYAVLLARLAAYRNATVRAKALLAWAEVDDPSARKAVLAALDDPDLRIRLLGLDMVVEHTTPELEEAALRLIERDAEVARAVAAARARG
jgi:hypothetical protein